MKTNELQIGDLVMYNPNVFIDDEYEPAKECHVKRISSGEDIDLAIEGCFYPIMVTEEILEKNGFEVEEEVEDVGMGLCNCYSINNDSVVIFWADSYNTMTSAGTEDFMEELWRMEVLGQGGSFKKYANMLYVHELQHALRLCGLNDLADNFKV